MKRILWLVLFLAGAALLALGISEWTGLWLSRAIPIALVVSLVVYLMLDLRPESNPGDKTIIRLTRGNWRRKKK